LGTELATGAVIAGCVGLHMSNPDGADPFAHLQRQAPERSDRTVERTRGGIAALRAGGQKITAESLKQATRELEPGFAGLSFQVIRRNPRAYALYREAADAFAVPVAGDEQPRPRPRERGRRRTPRSAYDPLQRLDKKVLIQRIRSVEMDLDAERQKRAALAYDQQALLAKMIRLETEIVLLKAERPQPE
jgi:hypothetical protein